jgi:hypothetical protein
MSSDLVTRRTGEGGCGGILRIRLLISTCRHLLISTDSLISHPALINLCTVSNLVMHLYLSVFSRPWKPCTRFQVAILANLLQELLQETLYCCSNVRGIDSMSSRQVRHCCRKPCCWKPCTRFQAAGIARHIYVICRIIIRCLPMLRH